MGVEIRRLKRELERASEWRAIFKTPSRAAARMFAV